MSRGNWLVGVASAMLLLSLAVRANAPQEPRASRPHALGSSPQDANAGDYLGSASCEKCHQADHSAWKNSLHIKMTRPVADATIAGDFREGTKFADHDRAYQFGMK